MARQIQINDREWIEIINQEKEVTGGFWWNPSDLDIVKRCEKVIEHFSTLEIKPDSELFAVSDEIKGQFNYLLDSPKASDELFKHSNPLTPRQDGELYAEYVLNLLVDFIGKEMNVRMQKSSARIKKYTEKYGR